MYVYVYHTHISIFSSHTDIARADAADVLDVAGGPAQAGGRAGIAIAGGGAGEAAVGVGGRHVGDVGGGGVDGGERHGDAGIYGGELELLFGSGLEMWLRWWFAGFLWFGGEASGMESTSGGSKGIRWMDGWMDKTRR